MHTLPQSQLHFLTCHSIETQQLHIILQNFSTVQASYCDKLTIKLIENFFSNLTTSITRYVSNPQNSLQKSCLYRKATLPQIKKHY